MHSHGEQRISGMHLRQNRSIFQGMKIDAESEIVVTCGSTEAMMAAMMSVVNPGGIIELVYIVLQSVVKPGITGFFKIDLHIKCYIYLS